MGRNISTVWGERGRGGIYVEEKEGVGEEEEEKEEEEDQGWGF